MKCPECSDEMISGSFLIRSSGWGLLFYGASSQHLYFKPSDRPGDVLLFPNGRSRPGHRCRSCGSIYLAGEESPKALEARWACGSCGEQVPQSFEVCWNCSAEPGSSEDPRE